LDTTPIVPVIWFSFFFFSFIEYSKNYCAKIIFWVCKSTF
jgi:hypothetical protein